MFTVLVPLDETAFGEAILPDAIQLAGQGGTLILVSVFAHHRGGDDDPVESSDVDRYLSNEADVLRRRGIQVTSHVLTGGDIPRAIDKGVIELGAEMVAIATHRSGHGGRLARSTIAWKALAHSPVPMLFRHQEVHPAQPENPPFRIMVPLDGSSLAERALPVASSLAAQWQATIVLAQIAHDDAGGQSYLDRVAQTLTAPVERLLGHGRPGEALTGLATEHGITHVVMTSHGRTGLSRVIVGDIAADLIERLPLPIIVVPVMAMPASTGQE
jgi:nucleotide-binding universal stress UspA family protein